MFFCAGECGEGLISLVMIGSMLWLLMTDEKLASPVSQWMRNSSAKRIRKNLILEILQLGQADRSEARSDLRLSGLICCPPLETARGGVPFGPLRPRFA
jgi:hypothetical protein